MEGHVLDAVIDVVALQLHALGETPARMGRFRVVRPPLAQECLDVRFG